MISMIRKYDFTQLSVHFVYKKVDGRCNAPVTRTSLHEDRLNCGVPGDMDLETISKYPMNFARNTARMFTRTKYIVLGDADLYYSKDFERRMRQAAERELPKDPMKVLVYRIFEIDEKVINFPRTKSDMKSLIAKKLAVPFHFYFYNSHEIQGQKEWLAKKENFVNTTISIPVLSYKRFDWEPRFVSLTNIPFHDENFPYRVRANNVLGWEMCRAGYKFAVVDDLYVFHRGIRYSTQQVSKENVAIYERNRKRFDWALRLFRARMQRDYPHTEKSCPAPRI